ncbi:MAG: M48 family metalloprotease [Hyphomicrobiales bacterium]
MPSSPVERVFINTGMLLRATSPNQAIGVFAHETGHIAGEHLTRRSRRIGNAGAGAIVAMLLSTGRRRGRWPQPGRVLSGHSVRRCHAWRVNP